MKHLFKFQPGQIYMTPGAMAALPPSTLADYLSRHLRGDWGCVCEDDKTLNDEAVKAGSRVLSAYPIDPDRPCKGYGDNVVWVITEADRSVTTFLLPSEY